MPGRQFPLIQVGNLPKGDAAFEEKRAALQQELPSQVPEDCFIAQHFIDSPPRDVTGIPGSCGLLTSEELEITEQYDATSLAAAIAIRKYTAVTVVKAFSKRAIICHQISCCLTQWFPEKAIEQAQALDEHLERTGKTVGPLHGVPISIKEHIPIAGLPSNTGFVSTITQDKNDCHMVAILRKLGAVFYVKTMQPQAIMHLETCNHLGRKLNPHNINLSSGGSSGGEAALIALRGSVLGVGDDIGGSIRGPAGCCGIYGFKSTAYTLPMKDYINGGLSAELNILVSTGPLCRSFRDMDLFVREVLRTKPYLTDPRTIPLPWHGLKSDEAPRPLKVGLMLTDGVIQPQPPVTRALEWARSRLASSSEIEVKSFTPYRPAEAIRLIRHLYWPDRGNAMKSALAASGEPMHPLSAWIIKDAEGDKGKTASEITKDRLTRDGFRGEFAESWTEQDIDVVLAPVSVGPAPAHDTAFYWNYTALWNMVDYPGVVFPTPIRAQKKGIEKYASDQALSKEDEHVRKLWEETDFEGAPIKLQLVARKHHDNLLFGALERTKELLELP